MIDTYLGEAAVDVDLVSRLDHPQEREKGVETVIGIENETGIGTGTAIEIGKETEIHAVAGTTLGTLNDTIGNLATRALTTGAR